MAVIILKTKIDATIERCFDLSRSIDLHTKSMVHSNEKAIVGVTNGLINLNETVTWEGRHFGMLWKHQSIISEMQFPVYFIDEMLTGAFKYFRHLHKFHTENGYTIMEDELIFSSPFGLLGKIIDSLFLKNYMEKLIINRNKFLKEVAENELVNNKI